MNILYVVPYAPSHIRVRPYELIRALHTLGHTVTVASLWSSAEEKADLDRLGAMGMVVIAQQLSIEQRIRNSLAALISPMPIQMAFSWQPQLAADLEEMVQGTPFDIVHVEHLRGARYGLLIKSVFATQARSGRVRSVPVVWDSVDCISLLFEQAKQQSRSLRGRIISRLELGRTRRLEGQLVHLFDRVLVSSSVDEVAMTELASSAAQCKATGHTKGNSISKLAVLPNGVDLTYFQSSHDSRAPDRLVFTGKMSYHANVTAGLHLLRDIMPRVWKQQPKTQVWIVGKDPPAEIRDLATCSEDDLARLLTIERPVVVTGTVPDIRPYLHTATIAVAPVVYGAGIQNKVLEAMACGAPVIASEQAVAALNVQHGRDLLVADNTQDFAQAVLKLLDDPGRRNELSLAGRAYVEHHHSWTSIANQLVDIYSTTCRDPRASA